MAVYMVWLVSMSYICHISTLIILPSPPFLPILPTLPGNGCVNDTEQNLETYTAFQHEQKLIPATTQPKTMSGAMSAMVQNLGYTPNYYDYRYAVGCVCYGCWCIEYGVYDG